MVCADVKLECVKPLSKVFSTLSTFCPYIQMLLPVLKWRVGVLSPSLHAY